MILRFQLPWSHDIVREDAQWAWWWKASLWLIALTPVFTSVLSTREFEDTYLDNLASGGGIGRVIAQGCTLLLFGLGLAGVLKGLLRGMFHRALLPLLLGAITLGAGPFLSGFLGISPSFSVTHLTVPVFFVAFLLAPKPSFEWFVYELKRLLSLYIYGSLLAALIAPGWTIQFSYTQGYIPGLNVRFHGLAPHANHFAVLLWIHLVCAYLTRTTRTRFDIITAVLGVGLLFLTQSKTTWAMTLATFFLLSMNTVVDRFHTAVLRGVVWVLIVVLSGAAIVGAGQFDGLEGLLGDRQQDLTSLTGRTIIWQTVLDVVRDNPMFGYGPHLFDAEMTLNYMSAIQWYPSQAHNQYIQSYGETGLIGLTGFLFYCAALLLSGWRVRHLYGAVAVILPVIWLLRGVTESWYRRASTDGNFLVHAFIFLLVVLLAVRAPDNSKGTLRR